MCGIFGVYSPLRVPLTVVEELVEENHSRGSSSFGYYARWPRGEILHRELGDYNVESIVIPLSSTLLLFHGRAPTSGSRGLLGTQPFISQRWVFGHNGILTSCPKGRPSQSDSSRFLDLILSKVSVSSTESVGEAIAQASRDVDGQFACFLYDREEEQLFLWRQMAPLFLTLNLVGSLIVFSSVKTSHSTSPVTPGEVVRVDLEHFRQEVVATFPNRSIYQGV
jgi:asparagine synthetase B (glutamine-hydrolysing)